MLYSIPYESLPILQVNKLVELYKESSEEWSKKAGELEGVIKALEVNAIWFILSPTKCSCLMCWIQFHPLNLFFHCDCMQTHLKQVESDYRERLENEASMRKQFEKVRCFFLIL